ncbi:MAG: hypothetical protein M1816_004825 [Peltula sp. TS41687]|nr:MAG: hypothetical protein M1816_004825 [Peltula sp. TS41687]
MARANPTNSSPTDINTGRLLDETLLQPSQSDQTRLQMLWDEHMKHPTKFVRHDKIVVLLLSWAETDDDLKTAPEVNELAMVFKDIYKYEVRKASLNTEKRPQVQINKHIAEFIHDHDSQHALLILYYAGHGWPDTDGGPRQFMLAGKTSQSALEKKVRDSIAWGLVETNLEVTEADILVIFDCCHAGALCRPSRGPTRRYEFLGACTEDKTTPSPGPASFTCALIWALKELANKKRFFASSELQHMIIKAPNFPKNQYPVLFHPFEPNLDHIVMAPLIEHSEPLRAPPGDYREDYHLAHEEYLDLRFYFNRTLDDETFVQMARALRDLIRNNDLSIIRIDFRGKYSLLHTVKQAAGHWLKVYRKRNGSLRTTPSVKPVTWEPNRKSLGFNPTLIQAWMLSLSVWVHLIVFSIPHSFRLSLSCFLIMPAFFALLWFMNLSAENIYVDVPNTSDN